MAHSAHGMWSLMRDPSVTKQKLPPGTVARILRFAAPYRRMLGVFLAVIVVDALIGVWNPLIYREIIDGGIDKHNSHLIVLLALLLAGLALVDALLSLAQRYISSRVGEGLIYDMREKVFGHIQEMPLAFFSRTQTGALISRLNNDVLGAQQAFTDTLSSIVSNLITVALTVAVMAFLSWQITVVALLLLPLFVFPARRIGRKLQLLTREAYNLNAQMNNTMTERFNVSGALLVKLFGRPDIEHEQFAGRAARVRDIGVQTAMYGRVFFLSLILTSSLATALVYGWGGVLAVDGRFNVGTVVALAALLTRLYGPLTALSNVNVDVMTALVSFDRVFEVLDLAPLIAKRPGAVDIAAGRSRSSSTTSTSATRRRRKSRWPPSSRSRSWTRRLQPGPLRRELLRRARPARGARRAVRGRQDDDQLPRLAPVRHRERCRPPERDRRPRCHLRLLAGLDRRRDPGCPPIPRDDPGEPALRQARRERRGPPRSRLRCPDPRLRRVAPRWARHRRG